MGIIFFFLKETNISGKPPMDVVRYFFFLFGLLYGGAVFFWGESDFCVFDTLRHLL